MRYFGVVLFWFGTFYSLAAQNAAPREVTNFVTWWNWNLTYRFTEKWSLTYDGYVRRYGTALEPMQQIHRAQLMYRFPGKHVFSLGHSFSLVEPYGPTPGPIAVPENRFHLQFTLNHSNKSWSFQHRYRYETRFFGKVVQDDKGVVNIDGRDFSHRIRYQFRINKDIIAADDKGKGRFMVFTSFEPILLLPPSYAGRSPFDQVRAQLGLQYQPLPWLTLHTLYMIQHRLISGGRVLETNHALQVGFAAEWMRKKKSKEKK